MMTSTLEEGEQEQALEKATNAVVQARVGIESIGFIP